MTTQDFIAKMQHRINDGENVSGKCSSVFAEGDTVYSYGYHYPLLFPVQKRDGSRVWVVNTSGYSNTTAKHISWARSLADVEAEMPRGVRGTIDTVFQALSDQLDAVRKVMCSKKRTNTQVYQSLKDQEKRIESFIHRLAD
jgi:hypothetical protein